MANIAVYTCKDGRTRVYDKDARRVMSYPKYLMEQKIGRPLSPLEEVHHIDRNPLNNDMSNLELRMKGEHQSEHSTKYFDKNVKCAWCGKEFVWTAKQQRQHRGNCGDSSEAFCSKSCCGSYGRELQLQRRRGGGIGIHI